jgi:Icc protein
MTRSEEGAGPLSRRTLRIVQLTDTHLYAYSEGRLLGQNTRRTLELVLDLVSTKLGPIDLILLTGDLVHDESPAGYISLQRILAGLGTPCYCLPGNHDLAQVMSETFDGLTVSIETSVRCGAWHLVFLDSTVPGEDGGHLDTVQLARLQDSLAERPDDPALVCLHHQPVPIGSDWMDTMALDNPEAFFAILDRNPQVRGIIWGHVHQEFAAVRNGVRLLGSPSTCVQFKPGSLEFALDDLTPGFRWLKLHTDGRIDTGVERIAAYPDPMEPGTGGY